MPRLPAVVIEQARTARCTGAYLDHRSAWLRMPGLEFQAQMGQKRLWLITTNGDRAKAQPLMFPTSRSTSTNEDSSRASKEVLHRQRG